MHQGLVKSQQLRSLAAILWQDVQTHYPMVDDQSLIAHKLQLRAYQGAVVNYLSQSCIHMAAAFTKQLADTRHLAVEDYSIEKIACLLKQQKFLSAPAALFLQACEQGVIAQIQQALTALNTDKASTDVAELSSDDENQSSSNNIVLIQDEGALGSTIKFHEWPVTQWLQALNEMHQSVLQDLIEC